MKRFPRPLNFLEVGQAKPKAKAKKDGLVLPGDLLLLILDLSSLYA
jgi:hypothetical protein